MNDAHTAVVKRMALPGSRIASQARWLGQRLWGWAAGPWRLAVRHNLNPWVFIIMSVVGYVITTLVYLPWFQSASWQLAFLILLRFVALVVPAYILIKGRRIAAVFNASIVVMFVVNTTWHVCYYLYL